MAEELSLPRELEDKREQLEKALRLPLPGQWPEGAKFASAEQPTAVGKIVAGAIHTNLVNLRIAWVFRERVGGRGEDLLCKASLASAKLQYLAKVDAIVEVSWGRWSTLPASLRVAMIDHALSHFARDDEGRTVPVRPVAEFGGVLSRWGAWQPQLATMQRAFETAQLSLWITPEEEEEIDRNEREAAERLAAATT